MELKELSRLAYDLRKDTVDMIMAGNGGHIGGDMSVMETLVTLYFDQMNISPENMNDPERDLFVMSKGHSVEAYYAVLAKKGFLDIKEVTEKFSKFGSQYVLVWRLQEKWIREIIVCIQLWVTANWQKVQYGKLPWQVINTNLIICVRLLTVTDFRFQVIQKMLWVTMIYMNVSEALDGM